MGAKQSSDKGRESGRDPLNNQEVGSPGQSLIVHNKHADAKAHRLNHSLNEVVEKPGPIIKNLVDALMAWPHIDNCKIQVEEGPNRIIETRKIMAALAKLHKLAPMIQQGDRQFLNWEVSGCLRFYQYYQNMNQNVMEPLAKDSWSENMKITFILLNQRIALAKCFDENPEVAIEYYQKELTNLESTFATETLILGGCYAFMAGLHLQAKNAEKALDYLDKSTQIRVKNLDKTKKYILGDNYELEGWAYLEKGDSKKAISSFNKAIGMRKNVYPKNSVPIIRARWGIADVFLKDKNYAKAKKLFAAVVKVNEQSYSPTMDEVFNLIDDSAVYADFYSMIKVNPKFFDNFEYIYMQCHYSYAVYNSGKKKTQLQKNDEDKDCLEKKARQAKEAEERGDYKNETPEQRRDRLRSQMIEEEERIRFEDQSLRKSKSEAKNLVKIASYQAFQVSVRYYEREKAEEIRLYGELLSARPDL